MEFGMTGLHPIRVQLPAGRAGNSTAHLLIAEGLCQRVALLGRHQDCRSTTSDIHSGGRRPHVGTSDTHTGSRRGVLPTRSRRKDNEAYT